MKSMWGGRKSVQGPRPLCILPGMGWGCSLSSHCGFQGPVTREAVEVCQELPVKVDMAEGVSASAQKTTRV